MIIHLLVNLNPARSRTQRQSLDQEKDKEIIPNLATEYFFYSSEDGELSLVTEQMKFDPHPSPKDPRARWGSTDTVEQTELLHAM